MSLRKDGFNPRRVLRELALDTRLETAQRVRDTCGNTICCNPRHLRPGSEAENGADRRVAGLMAVLVAAPGLAQRNHSVAAGDVQYGPRPPPRPVRRGVEISPNALPDDVALAIRFSYWNTGPDVTAEVVAAAHGVDVHRAANALRRQTHRCLPLVTGEPAPEADHGRIGCVSKRLRIKKGVAHNSTVAIGASDVSARRYSDSAQQLAAREATP